MKKIISILITTMMLCTAFTAVYAEDGIKVMLDGRELAFDVPPQIIDGRTLVPMRAIFEALGATVNWDGDAQIITAEKTDKRVTMRIGETGICINSEIIKLDVPPQIVDERTLVPVRAVSEAFYCEVNWVEETRTVDIVSFPTISNPTDVSDIPIEYDDTAERKAHEMRDFKILSLEKSDDGKYVMTYKLRTFLEGRGAVGVSFNCLNAEGNVVDSFGKVFPTTDYTWTWQEDTVTISGDTVKIIYVLND